MSIIRSLTSGTALLLALFCASGSIVLAQANRPWVDPPDETGGSTPPAAPLPQDSPEPVTRPAPSTQPAELPSLAPGGRETKHADQPQQREKPAVAAQPQAAPDESRQTARTEQAKAFAVSYLESWSARNDVALEDTAEFYAPRVLFHGRTVRLERLYKEKKRFARRWPDRDYRPRPDSIGSQCNPTGTVCTVHTVFDYVAANPARRRSSQGAGALQLVVEFIGEKPIIVAEHSTLLSQTRKRNLALEDASRE